MAKRISLREFQESLVQRLTSAKAGAASSAMLGVQGGRELWLTDLADAGEIVPLPPLVSVPLAKPWFRGIANVRGSLYCVIDFSAFQGGELTPLNSEARLLLPNARFAMNSALLVTRALGLRNPESMQPAGDSSDPRPWVAAQLRDGQGTVWNKLDFGTLLADAGFMEVGL